MMKKRAPFVFCTCALVAVIAVLSPLGGPKSGATLAASAKYSWLQFGFGPSKDGNNTRETLINAGNVSQLKPLFKVPLTDAPDGPPVLLADVTTPSGARDLVYVMGERGKLTAFDATTGATVWSKTFGTGGISNSSPAIDPAGVFIYVSTPDNLIHKLHVGDGMEVTTGGWPQAAGGGKSSSAPTIATAANGHTYLYCAKQGKGRILTIDLDTGTRHIFNMAASEQPDTNTPNTAVSGPNPWARGNPFVAGLDRFFAMAATNNGTTWVAGHVWRQSWVALAADGSTRLANGFGWPVDSYTPTNWSQTVGSDQDIGSGGLGVVPVGYSTKYPYLGVQPGKDQKIRILNLADLSGQGAPGKLGGELFLYDASGAAGSMRAQVATWTNPADGSAWAFTPGGKGLAGFKVALDAAGNPSLQLKWKIGASFTTSAILANDVLFAAEGGGERTTTNPLHELRAIEPTTGAILWRTTLGHWHWTSPIVANGVVYMCDGNSGGFGSGTTGNLMAWSLSATQVAAPVMDPPPGDYMDPPSIGLTSATDGAAIHYTTDGSTPTSTTGTRYTGRITVGGTSATIKAIAFKAGLADSTVSVGHYRFGIAPRPTPTPGATTQTYEAETTGHTSTGATTTIQNDTNASGGKWVSLDADGAGDLMEFLATDVPAGDYSVQVRYKTNNNRGVLRLAVDGVDLGTTLDQYNATVTYPTRIFGNVSFPSAATHLFRLAVTGKNGASSGFVLSADKFVLVPSTPTATPTPTLVPTVTPSPTVTPTATPTAPPTVTPTPGGLVEITPLSSAVTASTNDGNVPGNAVDNDAATRWSGNGDGAWLQLDLGVEKVVSRLTTAAYRGNERRNRFDVQVALMAGGPWTTVLAGAQTSGASADEEPFDFAPVSARFVRYVGHGATLNAGGTSAWNSVVEISLWQGGASPEPTPTPTSAPTPTPMPVPTATPTPTSGGPVYLWLEAESGTISAPMQSGVDTAASGGAFIQVAAGNNSQTAPPVSGQALLTFDVVTAGRYKIWGRVIDATNGDDSFWVRIDDGMWTDWNNIPIGAAWHWDDVHNATAAVTYTLATGSHTLTIAYREDGARLDRLLVTNDLAFVPAGTGP